MGEYEITTETEEDVVAEETDITAETGLIGGELEVIFTPAGDFVTEETESLYYIEENNLEVGSYSASEKVSWELEGTDAHLFTMTSDGVLSFNALPDYENPLDNDGDNKYVGTIKVITEDGSIF